MWLIAHYEPVALFTLKPGLATATGAKSLLIPTPFAIRTALLDIAMRIEGVERGPLSFNLIRQLEIGLYIPLYATVTNLFAKIIKPTRSDKDRAEAMQSTIAFREYVYWQGTLTFGFRAEAAVLEQVTRWLPYLNYMGRRGGFVQLKPPVGQSEEDELPPEFTLLTRPTVDSAGKLVGDNFPLGIMQVLDDWGPSLTFDKVNVFDPAPIRRPGTGEDRLRYGVIIPYQFRQSGRGFTLYERLTY